MINRKSKTWAKAFHDPRDVCSAHVGSACEGMDDVEGSTVLRCLNKAELLELDRHLEGRLKIQNYPDD